jgi:hypothetical protein
MFLSLVGIFMLEKLALLLLHRVREEMAHFANFTAFKKNNEKGVALLQKAGYRWNKRLT